MNQSNKINENEFAKNIFRIKKDSNRKSYNYKQSMN